MCRLIEHGIQNRHNSRLYVKEIVCSGGGSFFSPASMVDTLPAFKVMAWGLGGTVLIFFMELTVKYRKKLRKMLSKFNDWRKLQISA